MHMQVEELKTTYNQPNERGYFGDYGGKFVPEILIPAITALEEEYKRLKTILSSFVNIMNCWKNM